MRLLDERTGDGSRLFVRLPKRTTWQQFRDHVTTLPGAELASPVPGDVPSALFAFTYGGQRFMVGNGGDPYCLFVSDPRCGDVRLYNVTAHCEKL
jgi:hypothetical protein